MIPLTARGIPLGIEAPIIAKVVRDPSQDVHWPRRVFVGRGLPSPDAVQGLTLAISEGPLASGEGVGFGIPIVHSASAAHLQQGDVVGINADGAIRTLYRRASRHNTLFATDRCNSFCVMCSQPPKEVNDNWRIEEMLRTVELIDRDSVEIGISGGEPTLLGDGLLSVIRACRDQLPQTSLHILSNGRLFRYASLSAGVAEIDHHDLMFGVPVYSDLDEEHDYVVQAKGAFEDTILGLQNLGRLGVPVEIRVVIHRFTYRRLLALSEFIYRNLTFASHVALMGLEATGFAKANMDALWIDPADYRAELEDATLFLARRGMAVSIYNQQLCVMPESLWPYCRQSISDWKNEYHSTCDGCAAKSACGGFFMFNLKGRMSRALFPLDMTDPRLASLEGQH